MKSSYLLHHLVFASAQDQPHKTALRHLEQSLTYSELSRQCLQFARCLIDAQISDQERVAIYLEKRFEFVISCFGASCAGNIFVPINPILKPDQVLHILHDSGAKVLITSQERFEYLKSTLSNDLDLELIVITDSSDKSLAECSLKNCDLISWKSCSDLPIDEDPFLSNLECSSRPMIDTDAVSIFYTSGSTGMPKGVVLSHRNMVFGAKNVSSYLENNSDDVLLAALPLSFDAGFSQLTTGFYSGAKVVLLNYILPGDILNTLVQEKITGLTAVPPLWIQIANLSWPDSVHDHFRYFANTGGRMPLEILKKLRQSFPTAKPYLMYGLTESFRSTYLPPEEIDRRPDSIGKAIPNAEVLVLRPDGSPCGPREPGELVHRGALVGLGYWRDLEKTGERYKALPSLAKCRPEGIVVPELAVFSGDQVEKDEDGYIYFIGRNDEMIKTSGYRVSPLEIEEVVYNSGHAQEVAAFGVTHKSLGQAIVVSVVPTNSSIEDQIQTLDRILSYCKDKLPKFMIPTEILLRSDPHPRNQNGKIDRKHLSENYEKSSNRGTI